MKKLIQKNNVIPIVLVISLVINVFFLASKILDKNKIPTNKQVEEIFEQDNEDKDIDISKEGIYQNTFAGYKLEYPVNWKVLDVMGEKANSSLNFVVLTKSDINQIPFITIDNQIDSENICYEVYDQNSSSGVKRFDKSEFEKNNKKYIVTKTSFDDQVMNFSESITKYQYWDGSKCFHISVHDDLQGNNKQELDSIINSFGLNQD